MKKLVIFLVLVIMSRLSYAGTYSGGRGTQSDPYHIANATDLIQLGNTTSNYNKYFIMTADIDMSSNGIFTKAVIAGYTTDAIEFTGNFNGNGHTISNLSVNGAAFCGLFGGIGPGGVVSDLRLENTTIFGGECVGGLCGSNYYGSITRCYASGSINGIEQVGGLCGANYYGSIASSYASCDVNGTIDHIGGLCGRNYYGNISCSYACGRTIGEERVGGFCGENYLGNITSSFWNIDSSGQSTSDGGWGLTDTQMKQAASFYGWNVGDWKIDQENDYPRLLWEDTVGVVITTDYPPATYTGSGTQISPFELDSAVDLLCLMYRELDWNKHFILTTDIDMSGYIFNDPLIGRNSDFTGNFDGGNHVISNLKISGNNYCGLFGRIGYGGEVSDLGLENVNISGTGGNIGGLCGCNYYGSITRCYSSGSINGIERIGGLCGQNFYGIINCCYASGSVNGTGYTGGLCGQNFYGSISSSYAGSNVSGTGLYIRNYAGGLCGENYSGSITNCYASGSVSGTYTGGLCGFNWNGVITGSYAIGSVSGTELYTRNYVGGLCGEQFGSSAKIENCFWDTQASDIQTGYNLDSKEPGTIIHVSGKNTSQMYMQSTFTATGWDFLTSDGDKADWILLTDGYPHLVWEISTQYIDINQHTVIHASNTTTNSIAISSNASWFPYTSSPWITIHSEDSGNGNGAINYTLAANNGSTNRIGTISVGCGDITKTLTITQLLPTKLKNVIFKAGKSRAVPLDSFSVTGNMGFIASEMPDSDLVTVRFIRQSDAHLLFEDEFTSGFNSSKPKGFIYKSPKITKGKISYFKYDFVKGGVSMIATGQDFTGWETPLLLEVQMGEVTNSIVIYNYDDDYLGSVGADAALVLTSKAALPLQYLIGQKDYLRVLKNSVKTNIRNGITAGAVSGQITTNTASADVKQAVISWKDFSQTVNLTRKANTNYYFYKKAKTENSAITAASFNLDKCIFSVTVKGYQLGTAENFDLYLQ